MKQGCEAFKVTLLDPMSAVTHTIILPRLAMCLCSTACLSCRRCIYDASHAPSLDAEGLLSYNFAAMHASM